MSGATSCLMCLGTGCSACTGGGAIASPTRMRPSAADPFGQRPNPASVFAAMEQIVDARIEERLRGRTADKFNGIPDSAMVLELVARGFAVFKPMVNEEGAE